jgi:membrane protein implicated in regulation of membrane protease activity
MAGFAWWVWAIAAALVGLAELHAPGSYLIWIGLGAALTAALEIALGLTLEGQIIAFVIASAASCLLGYFVYRRFGRDAAARDDLNRRNLRLIGAKGIVCEALTHGEGKVRLGDSVWLAEGPNLPDGAAVVVKDVRGARVVVDIARDP